MAHINPAVVVELVDTQDLKSCAFGRAGSIPARGTSVTYLEVSLSSIN